MFVVTRIVDVLVAFFGLLILSPILLIFMFLVWAQDRKSPFYLAKRVAKGGGDFTMFKLRSMVVNAEKTGVNSTSNSDMRITKVGKVIRKCKLDELTQLINVLKGDMSLVGPRPQVRSDAELYTVAEQRMLTILPGITDFASIVFSDEGTILEGQSDPDRAYNELIRPWKSRLALVYVVHRSVALQLKLIMWTALCLVNKEKVLSKIQCELKRLSVDEATIEVASRRNPLKPALPPGLELSQHAAVMDSNSPVTS